MLVAYFLYSLIEIVIWIAIILYAYDQGGTELAGLVAVVQLLPAALLSPALAGLGDRMSRGTALVLSHSWVAIAVGLTTLALAVSAPILVVIGGAVLATMGFAIVRPAHFAALPALARSPQELVSANALSSSADGLAMFLGPVLAGAGAQVAGPLLVFALAFPAAVIAVVLCLRLSLGPPAVEEGEEESGWRAALRGVAVLWRQWQALTLLLSLSLGFILFGALDVLGAPFSYDVLGMGDLGAGLVIGAVGVGGLIGGLLAGSMGSRPRLAPVITISGVILGLAFASVSITVHLSTTMILLVSAGAAAAIMMVAGRTLLQRSSDPRVLARVFAVQEGTALLGLAIGAALAPWFVTQLSTAGAFVPLGLGVLVLVAAGYLGIRRLDARAVLYPEEIALLRSVPFLEVLPPYEREQLARSATWVEVGAGDVIVKQGDAGDRFYVIAAGEFSVSVDGALLPIRLRAGDSFGETALLWSVPRTATVACTAPGRLLALEAGDFLAAVTGSPDGHAIAQEVSQAFLREE